MSSLSAKNSSCLPASHVVALLLVSLLLLFSLLVSNLNFQRRFLFFPTAILILDPIFTFLHPFTAFLGASLQLCSYAITRHRTIAQRHQNRYHLRRVRDEAICVSRGTHGGRSRKGQRIGEFQCRTFIGGA